MENSITKAFNSKDFGWLEVIDVDGKTYFPATDCARMLGYTNPRDAILKHCKEDGVVFCDGVSETVNQYGTVSKIKYGRFFFIIILMKVNCLFQNAMN